MVREGFKDGQRRPVCPIIMRITRVNTSLLKHVIKNAVFTHAKTSGYGVDESKGRFIPGTIEYSKGARSELKIGFVEIESDEGVSGYALGGSQVEMMMVNLYLKRHLIGENPMNRERLWQKMWAQTRGPRFPEVCIGVIDVALWDLAGKIAGLSVSDLLGGYRDRIPAYGSSTRGDTSEDGILVSPEDHADHAERCLKRGFHAFKTNPTLGINPDTDIKVCKAIRNRVGDEATLMLDVSAGYTLDEAVRVGREIERLNFYWFEEPMLEYNVMGYVQLSSAAPSRLSNIID